MTPTEEDLNKIMVSVICTTFNQEKYIAQALDGFVMQQTNFKFEIIVHDDASTDKTPNIVKAYEIKYPRLFKNIYQTENQYSKGNNDVGKIVFSAARGKYIALCEGDDYWIDPNKLQKQFDFLESHPDYSMCFHNAIVVFEESENSPIYFNNFKNDRDLSTEDIISTWTIPTASMVFRKNNVLPLPFWVHRIYSGDLTLALLLSDTGNVRFLKDIMSIYRKTLNGISVILKNKITFVLDQKILLFSLFNEQTHFKYKTTIENTVSKMQADTKYLVYKNKFILLPFIFMPKYMINKIYTKFHTHLVVF